MPIHQVDLSYFDHTRKAIDSRSHDNGPSLYSAIKS